MCKLRNYYFRYARANNPHVEGYNPEKSSSFITYLDANNLYGWAMQQKLPVGGFEWLTDEEISNLQDDLKSGKAEEDQGYILDVDLDYPQHLHDRHNNYPLAPERMEIPDVSPYCKRLREKLNMK